MKKFVAFLLSIIILTGCNKISYTSGMYTDVRDWDFYTEAVEFCVNEGYIVPDGESFGAYETITLSECADVIAKITRKGESNPINYMVKHNIAPYDFGEWDVPATRERAACMIARAIEHEYINPVVDGAVLDAGESPFKDEIYSLYKMGVFSGDKTGATFRPLDFMTRSEMAVVIERICNSEKRCRFDKSKLTVSFAAFGDTIGHAPVLKAGEVRGGYDFTRLFENVRTYVENVDIACINQETIFTEGSFSGYPSFGSPKEIGIAEVEAGFDVITHATNHAFDRGEAAILYTTGFWDNYDVEVLGIHESEEDANDISVINKNGIKIAFLNYTYGLNGYVLPKGKPYLVDVLNEDKIKRDMARARAVSDAIVVFAHWGNEYQNTQSREQEAWAQLFADEGAVVIVGHHPHVVQPLETVTSADGREVPVYYSLGNFISNQNDYQNALCAMADFKIVKDDEGIRCEDYKIEGVVTHMQNGYYSAYLLKDYTEEMARRHKHRSKYGDRFTVDAYGEIFDNIVK